MADLRHLPDRESLRDATNIYPQSAHVKGIARNGARRTPQNPEETP